MAKNYNFLISLGDEPKNRLPHLALSRNNHLRHLLMLPQRGRGVVLYSGLVCLSLFLETMLAEGERGGGNGRASSFPLSTYLTPVEPFVLRRGAGRVGV